MGRWRERKKASRTGQDGAVGQDFVRWVFSTMDWGPIPVSEHDAGTDFFVQIRGDDLTELGLLLGVQVKNETAYFTPRRWKTASDRGYWEYTASRADVNSWLDHSVPHILALYDREARVAYWGHVTLESVRWTERGARIGIPINNVLGAQTRAELATIAAEPRRRIGWSGASWTSINSVPPQRRLRTALLAPRIAAPHPNQHIEKLEPEAAIARIMLGRFPTLSLHSTGVPSDEAQMAGPFAWRLHHALWQLLITGDISALEGLVAGSRSGDRSAVCALIAAAHLESGRVEAAVNVLDQVNVNKLQDPVDQAWIKCLRARCHYEVGEYERGRDISLEVAAAGTIHAHDPTAVALRSAALNNTLIQLADHWTNFDQVVIANDSPPVWWRDQHRAWALEEVLDRSFEEWSGNRKPGKPTDPETWASLRGLTLSTGVLGDHRAWRRSASALTRYELASGAELEPERLKGSLDDLRICGDKEALCQAAERILRTGPISALRELTADIELDSCTPTNLTCTLELLKTSMDVIPTAALERQLTWVLERLEDPAKLSHVGQGRQSMVAEVLIPLVRRAYRHLGAETQSSIRALLVGMPSVPGQSTAERFAILLQSIPQLDWTKEELESISQRSERPASKAVLAEGEEEEHWDHRSLGEAFTSVLARSGDFEQKRHLLAQIAAGDWKALRGLGSIREVPIAVLASLVPHLVRDLKHRAQEARAGRAAFGDVYSGEVLVIINWIHPEISDWASIEDVLSGDGNAWDQASLANKIEEIADYLPEDLAQRLLPRLEPLCLAEDEDRLFPPRLGKAAQGAVLALRRVLDSPEELRVRLATGSVGRRAVAREIGLRGSSEHVSLLMALAADPDPEVRASAATACTRWLQRDPRPVVANILEGLLHEEGYANAYAAMRGIDHMTPSRAIADVLSHLRRHPSGSVRRRAIHLIEHPEICNC